MDQVPGITYSFMHSTIRSGTICCQGVKGATGDVVLPSAVLSIRQPGKIIEVAPANASGIFVVSELSVSSNYTRQFFLLKERGAGRKKIRINSNWSGALVLFIEV